MQHWPLDSVVYPHMVALQQRVSEAIASAAPLKPHRDSRRASAGLPELKSGARPSMTGPLRGSGVVGGSLRARVLDPALLLKRRWGGVIRWPKIGPELRFFNDGTKHQIARPLPLHAIDRVALGADLLASAFRHYSRVEASE